VAAVRCARLLLVTIGVSGAIEMSCYTYTCCRTRSRHGSTGQRC